MALDLTRDVPRSPFAEVGGYPWLGRLVDKVRAKHAGTLGEYTPFPCGGDRRFVETLGIAPDDLEAVIAGGASDDQVAAWVREHQTPGADERLAAYRAAMLNPVQGPSVGYLEEAKRRLAAQRPELDLSQVDCFNRLICAEEGYEVP